MKEMLLLLVALYFTFILGIFYLFSGFEPAVLTGIIMVITLLIVRPEW